jgi:hypothetical protein
MAMQAGDAAHLRQALAIYQRIGSPARRVQEILRQ